MAGIAQLDRLVSPITAWARSRPDIIGLAVVGSWARGTARPDSDVDLVLLASAPQALRYDELWLAEIDWRECRVVRWHDADYGNVWSRHVLLEPAREIEFTFCAASWAATDPLDRVTANIVLSGCRIFLDKARLFERLVAVAAP
jgi:predicted nucleotidyltransferase